MTDKEQSLFEVLAQAHMVECPGCGTENPRHDGTCIECGAELPAAVEEPEPGVSVMMGTERPDPAQGGIPVEKIPLDEAGNLIKCRRAHDGILDGTMELEEYAELIHQVFQVSDTAVKLLQLPQVRKKIQEENLPPEQLQLVQETEETVIRWNEGMKLMKQFVTSRRPEDVQQGFKIVEECMLILDDIQDDALSRI
ncbi:MAG: zinc ribbon domain-containing protein [Armatimonadetes bacterium]|nr:zinc ribbon domain-containing protein [Armatimonadota bacterium]